MHSTPPQILSIYQTMHHMYHTKFKYVNKKGSSVYLEEDNFIIKGSYKAMLRPQWCVYVESKEKEKIGTMQ